MSSFARFAFFLFVGSTVTAGVGLAPTKAQDPTYVGANVDERIVVALRTDNVAVQARLPEGWQVAGLGDGPFFAANLMVVFIDRLLQMDAQAQPSAGGAYRSMALLVPARRTDSDEATNMVIRIYGPHDGEGPYKVAAKADVSREATTTGSNIGAGSGKETWRVAPESGGSATLTVEYQREVPGPQSDQSEVRSAAEPDFYRLYSVNQLVDIVNSAAARIDRAPTRDLTVTIPELADLFDGGEEIVGIAVIPSYARQTFLP